ncbi:triple tyrosine motif-containing protein [Parabacteroides sp. PF5-9]|uniref:helix-turn-helix and ligand-binding sensor domain-containing protein n=1 Tax=Parabacteroides sp. PF5-9 TaxID=1742404 RepID=UPI002475E325|nr:triple tyrosine motif-containing protein [Parabacteroides sp. PF5-9]MDH6357902.1 DNA-binding CsgD family transcriptional regulator [Parabacteroides sp. PF5-9]
MKSFFRFIICVGLLFPFIMKASTVPYIPKVINYSVSDYKAGNQNWAVGQGPDSKIYLGNNRGLLVFDGIRWQLYQLPQHTPVRSLFLGEDGRVYVGSFEEFGYFQEDSAGQLIYFSLKSQVQDHRFFNDEIWTIHAFSGDIYFQSFSSFFIYDGEHVRTGTANYSPLYFFSVDEKMYVQFIREGFYQMDEGRRFISLLSREQLNDDNVVAVLPYDDQLLLVTAQNGLYLYNKRGVLRPWNVSSGELLKTGIANRAILMPDSSYIIGTISEGIVAIDKSGNQLWHINRENGLMNNSILGLNIDTSGNLWVAMDNGVSQVQVNSPLYFYEPVAAQIGMVHDMAIKNDRIYLGTNQGVYVFSENDITPHLIPGTEEQTWYITDVGNHLIAGHNRGTLFIKDDQAHFIDGPSGGGTDMRKVIIHGKEVLIQVSYTSLSIFTQTAEGDWGFSHNVEGFNNLIRTLEIDPAGTIWASHMFKGLYRISLDETLQKVKNVEYIGKLSEDQEEGKINVMKLRGRIVLTDGSQFYTYEDLSDSIVPYDVLNEDFPELGDTYRIVSLNNDLFWFIRNTEYVLLSYEGGRFVHRMRMPFSVFENPTIEDRGYIYISTSGLSYFCLNGGIALFDPLRLKRESQTEMIPLSLSSVEAYDRFNNNCIMPNKPGSDSSENISFPFKYNTITFELSYPDYSRLYAQIRYKLEGFDEEWTVGTPDFVKSYSNLPYGKYAFSALVENGVGQTLAALSYPFEIKRPFYRSIGAIILYVVFGLALFIVLIRFYINRQIKKENRSIEEYRQKQKEKLEKQEQLIVQLKNEQLEKELTYKSKELASVTLARISQTDFLEELKKEIQTQQISGTYTKRFFEKVIHMIDENLAREGEWELYQANFDRIHENFFYKIKERYPDLTPGDLRMCALLRLNMPTKDMAKMLNLSVRGIEAARYRLRKKLDLSEGENLVEFMIRFN